MDRETRRPIRASTEQLLDAAPDGIVIIDRHGHICLVNKQAEALFGYRREELLGEPVELLVPDTVKVIHPERRAGYFEHPVTRPMGAGLELTARRKGGTEFPVDISLSSLQTEDGVVVCAAVRDITERKRFEAEFQGLLEAAPDAIVAVDSDGLIHLVNRQAELLFGYGRDELIGQPLELLVPDHVKDRHPGHRATYFAHATARPMGAGLELAAKRKDGAEFPVDISLSALETEEGVLVTAAVRDITDRRRIEEERAELQARLQRAQREEERAMLEAQLHQAQRLESVGQLAGGIAHDFNNLLAGIMNYAALASGALDREIESPPPNDREALGVVRQDVGEIVNIARRAADLTHQLLIFSRREVVKPEVLDLNGVVSDMKKLLTRTIGENIDLRTALDPELPHVKADRGQLEQILMNLVVNARDAMPAGGRLEVRTERFEVDDAYAQTRPVIPGEYIRLTVSDSGSGMSRAVIDRAFEPFFTTKAKGAGSGLGLATVYGIVTQGGGELAIYSEEGLGTTIRILLPATSDEQAATVLPDATALPAAAGTVLLVEDEEIVREPARRILKGHGYAVLAASSVVEALDLLARHHGDVDLLLTDVVMPERSGKELALEVTALSPTTKVLFMSGYSHDIIVHQGVLEPGVNLIEKPFTGEGLLRRVREVLEG